MSNLKKVFLKLGKVKTLIKKDCNDLRQDQIDSISKVIIDATEEIKAIKKRARIFDIEVKK